MAGITIDDLESRFSELYNSGQYAQALELVKAEAPGLPEHASMLESWQFSLLARLGDTDAALAQIEAALDAGHAYQAAVLRADPDLAGLLGHPRFEELMARSQKKWEHEAFEAHPRLSVIEPDSGSRPLPILMALHGNGSSARMSTSYWEPATQAGWLVALPQSSQLAFATGYYVWNDVDKSLFEIRNHLQTLADLYGADASRVIIGGFSMGGQIALRAAIEGKIKMLGFIGVEVWIQDMADWPAMIQSMPDANIRGYLAAGRENTDYLDKARQIQGLLQARGVATQLREASNRDHRFPAEFGALLTEALNWIA